MFIYWCLYEYANLDFIEISVWFSGITWVCTWMIISFDCLFTFFRKWIFFFNCAPNKEWRVSWVKWRWNDFYSIFQNSTMILSNCFGLKWFLLPGSFWIVSRAHESIFRVPKSKACKETSYRTFRCLFKNWWRFFLIKPYENVLSQMPFGGFQNYCCIYCLAG